MRADLDEQNIKELAQKHGLELPGEIEINDIGLDFKVAFTEDNDGISWVLRIPRRADVLPKAKQEYKTLEVVKKHLAAEVPDWKIFSDELIAYPRLRGIPSVAVDLEKGDHQWQIDRESPNFGRSFGKLLASLHTINIEEAAKTGLQIKTAEEIRRTVEKDIEAAHREIGISEKLRKRWDVWLNDDSFWKFKPSLIHGDIHQAHLLINKNSEITGVLDWTEAQISDPAYDFIFHQIAFGEDAVNQVLEEYEKAGGITSPKMATHIAEVTAAAPVKYVSYALETNQNELLETIRKQLND